MALALTGDRRAATGCAYHPPTGTTGGVYELRLDMDKLAAISIEFFGTDNAYYVTLTANPSPCDAP